MHVQEYWAEMQKIAVCVVIHFAHTAIFAYRLDKLLHVCFGTKKRWMLDHPTLTPLLFGFFVLINHQITDFFQIKFNNRYFCFNFHGFFLRHFAFEFVDYLYHHEEDKGDQ